MAAPSLTDITSMRGNADTAYGTAGDGGNDTTLAWNPAIAFLSQAAQQKAQDNQFKIQQFQKNTEDYYKNFGTIDVKGIMQKDYAEIGPEYAALANDIADNIDVIRNPMADQAKYAELKSREAALRSKIEQSKMDVGLVERQQDFIRQHPDLNTDVNNKTLTDFQNQPLGQRAPVSLVTPLVYDPVARAKVANEVSQQKLKEEQAQGKFLVTNEATQYLQDEYDKAWDALGAQQDRNGRTLADAAKDSYSKLPATYTAGKDFNTIDRQVGRSLIFQDDRSHTIGLNPVWKQEDEDAQAIKLKGIEHANRMAEIDETYKKMLENQQAKLQPKKEDAELLITTTAKTFLDNTGVSQRTVFDKSIGKKVTIDVVPLSGTELMAFARQKIGADNKPVLEAPEFVNRSINGTLTPQFKNDDGTYEAGAPYTPDKFMREFAAAYFNDKEVSKLLSNAKKAFAESTGNGTLDNSDALGSWLTKTNAWGNMQNNLRPQPSSTTPPVAPTTTPTSTTPTSTTPAKKKIPGWN